MIPITPRLSVTCQTWLKVLPAQLFTLTTMMSFTISSPNATKWPTALSLVTELRSTRITQFRSIIHTIQTHTLLWNDYISFRHFLFREKNYLNQQYTHCHSFSRYMRLALWRCDGTKNESKRKGNAPSHSTETVLPLLAPTCIMKVF